MAQSNRKLYTVEEYLLDEQQSATKHDYLNGQVYNMAGGSPEHSRIAVNLTSALDAALDSGDCQVFNSDLKVGVKSSVFNQPRKIQVEEDFVTYPDLSIVCGPLEFYKDDRYTLANPAILFEVLSPSTRNYDRSVKLDHYRNIASLLAYIMIDSERIWVEQYHRTGPASWQVEAPLLNLTDSLQIEILNITIPLSRIYNRVDFNEEE